MIFCRHLSFFIFFISFASFTTASAQSSNYVFGIGAGSYIYQGDLVPGDLGSYRHLKPALQLYAGKWINPYFQVQATFTKGTILANDSDYAEPAWWRERNLRFQTNITEVSARLVFSPFGNESLIPDKRLFPYIFAGAGASFVNIKRSWNGLSASFLADAKTTSNLTADSANGVPSTLLSIPFGAGITYVVSPHISLYGEAAYHVPVTDYLDGFSHLGNAGKKDNYYTINIGISYTLFTNRYTRCPTVQKHGFRFDK